MTCEACTNKQDNLCPKLTWTYNSEYKDDRGGMSQGGYADKVRVHEEFAFKIPDNLPSDQVAPLLCAGLTTFAPLVRHGVKQGSRVGVIGIGGLGHLAVQWASKMGARVTAISHTANKKQDADKLGAQDFVVTSDETDIKRVARSLDIILCSSISKSANLAVYLNMLKNGGTFVMMSVPETTLSFPPGAIVGRQITVAGSIVGSREDMHAMLEFASQHDVRAWVQTMPMEQVNEAIVQVMEGQPRYRVVLENRR
jgi:D-arabinose 1-dehydrogenase-like Zn-dependent alcohol dehydrogenase